MKGYNVEYNCIGLVSGKEIIIDEASLGTIVEAKNMYDNALENYLK